MAKRVVVVGAGVVGLSAGYYAALAGHDVTVLDRGAEGEEGCSWGNAGMIVPSHFVPLAAPGMVSLGLRWMLDPESPFRVRLRPDPELLGWAWRFWRACTPERVERAAPVLRELNLAGRAAFEALAQEWGEEFGLRLNGLLSVCLTQRELEHEARLAEQAAALGIPAEVLDPAGLARREPALRFDVAGAVLYPLDAHLDPGRFLPLLRRRFEALGGRVEWGQEVTGWRVAGRRVEAVRTTRGERTADEFVLAAGAWSSRVTAGLRVRLPLQPGKGYSLMLPAPDPAPTTCAILADARVAITPMGDRLRFAGTMELGGLDLGRDPRRIRGIVRSVGRYLPEFTPDRFEGVPSWCGLRPCSPDGLPYLGRLTRHPNLVAATGHAMMGLSTGPVTGRLVAEILSDQKPSLDIALFDPERHG